MKNKLLLCFIALCGMLFCQPASAFWKKVPYPSDAGKKTGRVQPNEIEDGMFIIFEAAVGSYTTGTLSIPPTTGANVQLEDLAANIPATSVWVLEKNIIKETGTYDTYFLKSYTTNQYIGAATYITDATKGSIIKDDSRIKMVDTQDEAVPFAILSQSSKFNGSGQNNTGDPTFDKYSVVIMADPSVYGVQPYQRALNCSAPKNMAAQNRISLSHWTGLRTWDAYCVEEVSGGEAILEALLESYTAKGWTPEKYKGGTNPGYYDADLAASFAEAWSDVEDALDKGNVSEADANTLSLALDDAQKAVDATLVPLTDGWYYIQSANAEFSTPKALYSTGSLSDPRALKWGDFDQWEPAFAYKITSKGSNKYTIQNMLSQYYINVPGTYKPQTMEPTTLQTIDAASVGGQFFIANATKTSGYAANDGYADEGYIVNGKAEANTISAWTFVPIDESMVASLEEEAVQGHNNIVLDRLITEAKAEYDATAVISKIDEANPLVTDAAQFTTNAPEPLDNVGVDKLIDGLTNTYFHTRWSGKSGATEPHYLCAKFENGVNNFAFKFQRRAGNENNYPLKAALSVSDDSVTWIAVDTLSIPMQQEYTSPVFNLDKAYKYIKYSALQTSNGSSSNGETSFCYAEFNYYPATIDANRSASVRADLKDALAALKTAIDAASAVKNATTADVDALQAALDAYKNIYPDINVILDEIKAAQAMMAAAPVQDDALGYYPTSAVTDLSDYIANMGDEDTFAAMTRQQQLVVVDSLKKAESAFKYSLNVGEEGKLYYIDSNAGRGTWNVASISTQPNAFVYCSTAANVKSLSGSYWQLRRSSDSTVYIQNAATGLYLRPGNPDGTKACYLDATPYEYVVTAFGDGNLTFIEPGKSKGHLYAELTSSDTYVTSNGSTPKKNNYNMWVLKVADSPLITTTMKVNEMRIMTLPFATAGTPISDGIATRYKVVGTVTNGDGAVTQIKVVAMGDDEPVAAGVPFLLESGDYTNYDPDGSSVNVNLNIDLENLSLTSQPAEGSNGLCGVLYNTSINKVGYGYFEASTLKPVEEGATVSLKGQTGYLNIADIKDTSKEYAESDIMLIDVDGAIVNGIHSAVVSADALVNVYTTDGVLVKKAVKYADALNGLAKGVYIVGNKKAVVK